MKNEVRDSPPSFLLEWKRDDRRVEPALGVLLQFRSEFKEKTRRFHNKGVPVKRTARQRKSTQRTKAVCHWCVSLTNTMPKKRKMIESDVELSILMKYLTVMNDLCDTLAKA